ncbi:XVIPCD domain-containing protein [Pseudomonas sp. CGJS7]|uniref:XVIPCD domain-containing protein n=1 Tax=Pseudomonas sp. CGJS7 TaxID=3109348 RepID=UPI003008568C
MEDKAEGVGHARNVEFLKRHGGFSELPSRFQELVLKSPHASADFAGFYTNGGRVVGDPREALASYRSEPNREIRINQGQYEFAKTPGGAHLVNGMFSRIAHEIGHDKDREANFSRGTGEEYVQFRSEKEAKAIFNAFPIFDDLRKSDPSFKPQWDGLGYSPLGVSWPPLFNQWRDGRLSDSAVIKEIAKTVADYPYTRNDGLIDRNGDGRLTQRDLYLQDYRRLLRTDQDAEAAPKRRPANEKTDAREGASTHPLLNGLDSKVRAALGGSGVAFTDTELKNAVLSLAAQSSRAGLQSVDHVVLGHPVAPTGERNLFAVQGDLEFPGHLRAHLPLSEAVAMPTKNSLQSLAESVREAPSQVAEQSESQRASLSRS